MPPDYNLHVLLTGFCKLLSSLTLTAVQRSRGLTAADAKAKLGNAQADLFSAAVAGVAGHDDGVHQYRQNKGGVTQGEALLPGRRRWALLFALTACCSQGSLPHTPFRRGVIAALEALLGILTLSRFRATGPGVTELLLKFCDALRRALRANFAGKGYKGGGNQRGGVAEGGTAEWSFRKFHALLEAPVFLKLYGQWGNYGCEIPEMLNGEWFKDLFLSTNGVNTDTSSVPGQMGDAFYDLFFMSSMLPNFIGAAQAPFACLAPPVDAAALSGTVRRVRSAASVGGLSDAWSRLVARCPALRDVPQLPAEIDTFPVAVVSRAEEVPAGARNFELFANAARVDSASVAHFYPGSDGPAVGLVQPRVPMYNRLLRPDYVNTALLAQPLLFFRVMVGGRPVDFAAVAPLLSYATSERGEDYVLFKPRVLGDAVEVYPLQSMFSVVYPLPWFNDVLPAPLRTQEAAALEERVIYPPVPLRRIPRAYLLSTFVR
jgi:hypothetical protein